MALPVPLIHCVDFAREVQRVPDLVGPQLAAQLDRKPAAPLGGDLVGESVGEIFAVELRAPEQKAVLLLQIELANRFGVFYPREIHPFARRGGFGGSGLVGFGIGGKDFASWGGEVAKEDQNIVRSSDRSDVGKSGVR